MADGAVIERLDRLAIELVAMTARALNESDGQAELTLAQWRSLAIVASSEGIRPGDLADRMGMSRPSVSRLVRRLVHKGLVVVGADPEDGRAATIRSAPLGRLTLAETRARRRRLLGMP